MNSMSLLLSCVLLAVSVADRVDSIYNETRLMKYLLEKASNVSKYALPRDNNSPIHVRFGLRLIHINLDEKHNNLEISVWVRYSWKNAYLTWNPAEYGGIKRVIFPVEKMWLPEISLVNTGSASIEERFSGASLQSTGNVFWVPHRVYNSACLVDVTNYPYDSQTCDLWFQSLGRPSSDLSPQVYGPGAPFDLDTYVSSFKHAGDWILTNNISERVVRPRNRSVILVFSRRPALRFSITLQRIPGFTSYILMLPCLLLAGLTVIVFCLPPERPDRNALATSLFGSLMLLLLVLVQVAPPSAASIPILGIFYAFNMLLIVLAIVCSAIVGRIRAVEGRMSKHLRSILIDGLARIMFVFPKTKKKQIHKCPEEAVESRDGLTLRWHLFPCNRSQSSTANADQSEAGSPVSSCGSAQSSKEDTTSRDWYIFGRAVDRLLILFYTTALIIAFWLFFPRPKNMRPF